MKALVLEKINELKIRDIEIPEMLGVDDVRIAIKCVGVCGSDVHYYTHGAIGPYVVKQPMVVGHEAAGEIIEVGGNVTHLQIGDRVCMEPGIPNFKSRSVLMGMYNLDPEVVFWATPPVHGCLRTSVVHPASFTYKLPDNVSFGEGAMVEPLAIGLQAASKANIKPGDTAVVLGAGTIGVMIALSALAGGCSKVIITDVKKEKLDLVKKMGPFSVIDSTTGDAVQSVKAMTDQWGAEIVFDSTGNERAIDSAIDMACSGGKIILVGCPLKPVPLDIVKAQAKELCFATIFRYANMYDRAIKYISAGTINVKPMITATFPFDEGIKAFDLAAKLDPRHIKIQIELA